MQEFQLKELLNSLTLKEKIGQLIQLDGSFFGTEAMTVGPREKLGISEEVVQNIGSVLNVLGAENVISIQRDYLEKSIHKIPLLFMGDIVYGYRTILPIPLGLGATWNPDLIKKGYQNIATEASKAGAHVTFAPMVDLARDPRWGRSLETTGEDGYLNSVFAKSMVEGFQGDFGNGTVASCVKHFAAYGAAEGGRDYNTVDMSERRLREDYLPAYKAALDAGAKMVMTSFNTVDGIPATGNKWLMDDLLRKEWEFDGVIITDYAAIQELIAHGVARDDREASKLAIEATVDIDMKTPCYANQLPPLIEEGSISERLIDEAVWRVLTLKNDLGLFENPYQGADLDEEKYFATIEHRELARKVASESLVLLKNKNSVLPLKDTSQKIALIGPYADSKSLTGLWAIHARAEDTVSLKTAFEEFKDYKITYAQGSDYLEDYSELGDFGRMFSGEKVNTPEEIQSKLEEAKKVAEQSDIIILALGEHTLQSGEAGSRTNLTLPDIQLRLLNELSQLGKPIVLVLFNGRPLVLTEIESKVDAIIEAWFPGTEGGHALVDVLTGVINPSGKLSMSFPYCVGQIPVYYNCYSTGRPLMTSTHSARFMSRYLDSPNDPLYSFGYGLSYTKFDYECLSLSQSKLSSSDKLYISVKVTNSGDLAGFETVQLYIRDMVGSVVRPVKELKAFKKVWIEPKETITVTFELSEEQLRFYTSDMTFKSEKGEFEIFVGGDSLTELKEDFELI